MPFVILSGLSGAGKTQAIDAFEDAGYFCVDNLPPQLLSPLVDLFRIEGSKVQRVAVVCDVRGGEYFAEIERVLDELGAAGVDYSLVFLEASDDVLVARFKETRRRHPLAAHDSVLDGIKRERELLDALRERANHIIDTSGITIQELKLWLNEEIIHRGQRQSITFSFVSFGYKYGIPIDADLLFDVRFLPNPFYDLELRPLTGLDREVRDYVLRLGRRRRVLRRAAAAARLPVPALRGRGQGAPDDRHRLHRRAPPLGDASPPGWPTTTRPRALQTTVRHRDMSRG